MAKLNILVYLLFLASITVYEVSSYESLYSQWVSYKTQYGKHYTSHAEEYERMKLFTKNWLIVERFNQERSKDVGYTMAVNYLSDRTERELKQVLRSRVVVEEFMGQQSIRNSSDYLKSILEDDAPIPETLDWRETGRVSAVKFQGLECASGWAFATIGMLEGQELPVKQIDDTISLSAQNVMDCSPYSDPCLGGDVARALITVADEGGVESQSTYPYKSVGGSCKYNKSRAVIASKGYINLPALDEDTLKKVVARYGPVAATIYVNENFMNCESGVFIDQKCLSDLYYLNHAVLIVGYGTDLKSGDYWIVKNSWSNYWGESGYVRMARNKLSMCGISTHAVMATF